jgi:hypothetical protein
MGCFNKTAFYSHLPITASDEIVMFVCADSISSYTRRDNTPISVVGAGLAPIAPPFFGRYNDYGSIELVKDDANHQLFNEKFGMHLEEFCDIMHDLAGITIEDLIKGIEEYRAEEKHVNKYHHETLEDFEKLLAIYENVFGKKPELEKIAKREGLTKEAEEQIAKVEQQMYEYDLKKYMNSSIMVTMEHKSVYDKMVELGRQHYFDYWIGIGDEKKVTPEEAFDNSVEVIKKLTELSESYKGSNIFTFGINDVGITNLIKSNISSNEGLVEELFEIALNVDKNMRNFFGIKACLHDTVYASFEDHVLYNNLKGDLSKYKEIACDYAYFLQSFKHTCTTFDVSPYHSQTVDYERLIPIYEEFLNTLKKQYGKYNEE